MQQGDGATGIDCCLLQEINARVSHHFVCLQLPERIMLPSTDKRQTVGIICPHRADSCPTSKYAGDWIAVTPLLKTSSSKFDLLALTAGIYKIGLHTIPVDWTVWNGYPNETASPLQSPLMRAFLIFRRQMDLHLYWKGSCDMLLLRCFCGNKHNHVLNLHFNTYLHSEENLIWWFSASPQSQFQSIFSPITNTYMSLALLIAPNITPLRPTPPLDSSSVPVGSVGRAASRHSMVWGQQTAALSQNPARRQSASSHPHRAWSSAENQNEHNMFVGQLKW